MKLCPVSLHIPFRPHVSNHELFEVYAPCSVQLRQWSDVAMVAVSRREAYEAAAMGPRGVCLKDQGGALARLSPQRKTNMAMEKSPFLIEDMYTVCIFKLVGFPLSCMSCYINFCKGLDGDETSDDEYDDNTSSNQSVS